MNKLHYISIVLISLLLFAGCATTPQSLQSKSKAIAWIGTKKALEQHPEWKPHFLQAKQDLDTLSAQPTIDPIAVAAIVSRLPVKELKDGDTSLYITGALLFFEGELGSLTVDNPERAREVTTGLSQGIGLAIPQ